MNKSVQLTWLWCVCMALSACGDEAPTPIDPPVTGYQQYGTPFSGVPAVEDMVMYEVNLRGFSSGGNLQGVISRLDALKKLGVNVIWLMPIHPIGTVNSVNSPYAVRDYKAIGAEYGTLSDLRALTDQAHARGMAVIMDWVANHTAWDHPWTVANKSWYTQDAAGAITHPAGTNWMDVADLNFDNPQMRAAMIDAMRYWMLEANVDGYRCDYADGVPVDFWTEALATLDTLPDRQGIWLAEGGRRDHFTAGFDMIYAWDYYDRLKRIYAGEPATSLYATHVTEYSSLPSGKHRLRYTTNHDQSAWENTPMVLFNGKAGALGASVCAVFMEGVPLFYTGQETGRVSTLPFFSNSPVNWDENPDMQAAYAAMMAVYTRSDAARKGTLASYADSDVVCFEKTLGTSRLLVMVNVRNTDQTLVLPAFLRNTTWTDALTGSAVTLETSVPLAPYQYLMLEK
ncbi:MAG: alpha-amylase family glycosyl hydrolase [Bacteroidia bacterium]|nr:alpha-amylase family glycosyl hydrolase [Bacteroidia bacterium]